MQFGLTSIVTLLAATAVMAAPADMSESMIEERATCPKTFTVLGYSVAGCSSSAVADGLAVTFKSFANFGVNKCQQSDQGLASLTSFKSANAPGNCYVRTYSSSDCSTRQGATCANGPTIQNGGQCTNTSGGLLGGVLGGSSVRSFKVVCGKRPAACTS